MGAVLDGEGRPTCSELSPGNGSDIKTLLPMVALRLKMSHRRGPGLVTQLRKRGA